MKKGRKMRPIILRKDKVRKKWGYVKTKWERVADFVLSKVRAKGAYTGISDQARIL
jgi:hypothetical protein